MAFMGLESKLTSLVSCFVINLGPDSSSPWSNLEVVFLRARYTSMQQPMSIYNRSIHTFIILSARSHAWQQPSTAMQISKQLL